MSKFQNREKALAKLAALPKESRKNLAKALEVNAAQVVNRQKALSPVDKGGLLSSITWKKGGPKTKTQTSEETGDPELTVTIFSSAWYAHFVEFGTSPFINKGKYKGTKNPGQKAQPFFYPGYRVEKKSIKARMSRAITSSIKKVTGK